MRRSGRLLLAAIALVGAPNTDALNVEAADSTCADSIRHDESGELPPVGDQGRSFACAPWATRTIVAYYDRLLAPERRLVGVRGHIGGAPSLAWVGKPDLGDPTNRLSVAYLNNLTLRRALESQKISPCEAYAAAGTNALLLNVGQVLETLNQFGVPSERDAPFTARANALPTPLQIEQASALRDRWASALSTWTGTWKMASTQTRGDLCAALKYGPSLVVLFVYDDFDCSVGAEYAPRADADARGRHAIVVVAFQSDYTSPSSPEPTAAFRLMNSAGTSWGAGGSTWVTATNLFGEESGGRNLVSEIHSFNVASKAPCPEPASWAHLPPAWFTGDGAPWVADPQKRFCRQRSMPICPPTATPPTMAKDARERFSFELKRILGARGRIQAPPIPNVPALVHSTVRYTIDGVPARTINPAKTGFAFHFVDSSAGAPPPPPATPTPPPPIVPPTPRTPPPEPRAPPGPRPGPGPPVPDEPPPPVAPGSGRPEVPPKGNGTRPDADIGADPMAIGAFIDRAVLEIVDPNHPNLVGGKTVRILVETFDPDETEPHDAYRYVVHIAK